MDDTTWKNVIAGLVYPEHDSYLVVASFSPFFQSQNTTA